MKWINYHHDKFLIWLIKLIRNLHGAFFMIHTKSCKIRLQPLQAYFVSFSQSSWKFSMLNKESCLRQTRCKHVSFCLNDGKSWKVSLETCKFIEIFSAMSTRGKRKLKLSQLKKRFLTMILEICFALFFDHHLTNLKLFQKGTQDSLIQLG